jgi:preprotein translocase subunit SecB
MQKSAMLAETGESLDMEAIARVAQKAVLDEIHLVDAQISRDPLISSPEALTLEHRCSTKILQSKEDKNILPILCNFRVVAFSGKSTDKILMSIEASLWTSYVLKPIKDFNPDDIEHFAKINPIYNAWPYWREFVQNMTIRMGFPALTIPLLKIMPKKAAAKKAKSPPAKKESARRKKVDA